MYYTCSVAISFPTSSWALLLLLLLHCYIGFSLLLLRHFLPILLPTTAFGMLAFPPSCSSLFMNVNEGKSLCPILMGILRHSHSRGALLYIPAKANPCCCCCCCRFSRNLRPCTKAQVKKNRRGCQISPSARRPSPSRSCLLQVLQICQCSGSGRISSSRSQFG